MWEVGMWEVGRVWESNRGKMWTIVIEQKNLKKNQKRIALEMQGSNMYQKKQLIYQLCRINTDRRY